MNETGSYGAPHVSEKTMWKSPEVIAALNNVLFKNLAFTVIPRRANSALMSSSTAASVASPSRITKSNVLAIHCEVAWAQSRSKSESTQEQREIIFMVHASG
jgi:hypothetical protein